MEWREQWQQALCWTRSRIHILLAVRPAAVLEADAVCSPEELCTSIVRLDEALWSALQQAECHKDLCDGSLESYTTAMSDLLDVLVLSRRALGHCPDIDWRLAACTLENVYLLRSDVLERVSQARQRAVSREQWPNPDAWVRELCYTVCRSGSSESRTRATLQQVYHHALHGRYSDAEALLALSGAQTQAAASSDVPLQVMGNCALAQLGLCAFLSGRLHEANLCLRDLCARGRARCLLGSTSPVPLRHPHISPELVEAAALISTLLLKAPSLFEEESFGRASQGFSRELHEFEQAAYVGPPEDTRERILAAASRLKSLDWEAATELLEEALRDCSGSGQGPVLGDVIRENVKVAALKVYLTSCAHAYHSVEVTRLTAMCGLHARKVRSIVNVMILEESFPASWDEGTQILFIHEKSVSRIGSLACQLAAQAEATAESNESLVQALLAWSLPEKVTAGLPAKESAGPTTATQVKSGSLRGSSMAMRFAAEILSLRPTEVVTEPGKASLARGADPRTGTVQASETVQQGMPLRGSSMGRQSAFRKSLTNLNKAVKKWARQLAAGDITFQVIEERIRVSTVVQELKRTMGDSFREVEFVCDLLSRAGIVGDPGWRCSRE